ncbi:monooxygenase [Mycobacterium sp. SWH-M3]|nr:monooxygenase [Mycobacterium sp. SWH-M3]
MKILVSGGGIAGLACALEFGRRGHDVTVIERAPHLRLTGTPIDIRGDAIEAVEKMGLLTRIQARRVRMSEQTQFLDIHGEPIALMPIAEIGDSDDDIEILREDLVGILADAVSDAATIRFDDSIKVLAHSDDHVDAQFASGRTARYDLVVGADGQYSAVRRLVFGPDEHCLRHLGVYFALAHLPDEPHTEGANSIYNVPGRMAGVFRYGGKAVAVFEFRSESVDYDPDDVDGKKQILFDALADYRSWRIPELLEAARVDPAFYFSAASQVHLTSWHRGRVVLVGDAGYCAAFLSGRGTSLALTGARFLAEELDRDRNHTMAFARYEARQRPYVTFAQGRVSSGRDRILPTTWADIAARNQALKAASTRIL